MRRATPKHAALSFHGFSIIEVVIAAALVAMLGVWLFISTSNGIQAKNETAAKAARYHAARQALERMEHELSMAYLSAHRNANNLVVTTLFKGEEEKITFSALGNMPFVKEAHESDQQELSYYVERDDRTNKPALMRRVHKNLTLKPGEEGNADVLCSDVVGLKLKYWDEANSDWKKEWSSEGSFAQPLLPARIEIELTILIYEREVKFVTQVELWMRKPIMIAK